MPALSRIVVPVAAAAAVVAAAWAAVGHASPEAAPATVKVTAREFSYALSRTRVPAGKVRFVVVNKGQVQHDFVIAGRRTRILAPGQRQTITVTLPKSRRYAFLCSVPGHKQAGMKGTLLVGKAKPAASSPPPPPPPPDTSGQQVRLTEVGTFERPVLVTSPPGDPRRVVVVEQAGRLVLLKDGERQAEPFLDIRDEVGISNEPGLLSLAFAPDYTESGKAYVFYNDRQGNKNLNLVELRRHAINPDVLDRSTARRLLHIVKPYENHNAGMTQFGPDGMLYVSVGDGDSGVIYEPGHFAQSRDELLGNILRIDPSREGPGGQPYAIPRDNPFVGEEGVRPEIFAYGLRNPWRFWIDHGSGDMLIGDNGLWRQEEIDLVPAGTSGQNFGWPCLEGSLPLDGTKTCEGPVAPLLEYPHEDGHCSVIGGIVLRDPRLAALEGRYLWGDFCKGEIHVTTIEDGKVVRDELSGLVVPQLTSFGVDGLGRVYAMALTGQVFRLDPLDE